MEQVCIFDTTLRDGDQTPGVRMGIDDKVRVARMLEEFGVDAIEAGFPASSTGDTDAVARVAHAVRHCEVAALARCRPQDIQSAADALTRASNPVIHVFLGTSDVHLARKLRMTRAQALRAIRDSVRLARDAVSVVQFTPEDATRTERPFLRQCVATAIEAGAARVNIPDTVGCATPREYSAVIGDIVRLVGPDITVSAHCHDDLGLATANSIAAIEAGARQVECTVNGIGERAGNAAVEQVGVALSLKGIAPTRLDLAKVAELSRHVADVTGVHVQPHRAIVGRNAFAHSSGIHQDGLIKDPRNYEFVPPSLVGVPGHRFVLTAKSGRSAIAHQAAFMGVSLDPSAVDRVYAAFMLVADQTQGEVSLAQLARIIAEVREDTHMGVRQEHDSTPSVTGEVSSL